jgi:hypothetical protein
LAERSTLIRNEPCPKCGSYMIWTPKVWRVERDGAAEPERVAAYVCENPTCGIALDPAKHPRDVVP